MTAFAAQDAQRFSARMEMISEIITALRRDVAMAGVPNRDLYTRKLKVMEDELVTLAAQMEADVSP